MKIVFAADPFALSLRKAIVDHLKQNGHEVIDFGASEDNTEIQYYESCVKACEALQRGEGERAILLCGTGMGMNVIANRFKGVRAAVVESVFAARMCRAINDFCMLDSRIKWPNDIIVGKKKLVGILTEMSAEFDMVDYTVTGIGINVGQTVFPSEISHKATSILLETGRHIDQNKFIAAVLNYLEQELIINHYSLGGQAVADYQKLCATIGRQVTFSRGKRNICGMAVSVNNSGELDVMLSNGTIATVNSGEVTVQGIY